MAEARYVELPGELVLRQPIALTGATLHTWWLDADRGALRTLCDDAFNRPSGGALEYRPLLPAVMLVCADIARGQSLDPADAGKGGMPERDLGFWVPLARGRTVGARFVVDALVWYHPYLFIDNAAAFVVGRETYGFRKYLATCTMPTAPGDPATFAVDTLVIDRFGKDATGRIARLWQLDAADAQPHRELIPELHTLEEGITHLVGELRERFADRVDELPVPSWQLVETLLADLARGEVPMVFLRQFRDVARPDLAAYQAIVEAPCRLTRWHGGGLTRPARLTILPVDSHPIVTQLGLAGAQLTARRGLWTKIDFVMAAGRTLWQAGQG
jgi:hypothetical protein